jgi:hypothetical protein
LFLFLSVAMTLNATLALISGLLSFVSSLFIIVSILRFPTFRTNTNSIICALSVSTLFSSVAYVIGALGLASNSSVLGVSICQLQAFIMTASEVAASNWTTCLSIYLLLTLARPKASPIRFHALMGAFCAFSFLLPLCTAGYVAFRDAYGLSGTWCFIACSDANTAGCFFRMALFYDFVFLAFALSLVTMLAVTLNGRRLGAELAKSGGLASDTRSLHCRRPRPRFLTASPATRRGAATAARPASAPMTAQARSQAFAREALLLRRRVLARLRLYLLVYGITWVTPSISRIGQMFDPDFSSPALATAMAALNPIIGFGNFLVFVPEVIPAWFGHTTRDIWGSYAKVGYHYHTNAKIDLAPSAAAVLSGSAQSGERRSSGTLILPKASVRTPTPLTNPLTAYRSVQL